MVGGIYGKFGNVGNVDSVTCRYIRAGEGTNPPLSTPLMTIEHWQFLKKCSLFNIRFKWLGGGHVDFRFRHADNDAGLQSGGGVGRIRLLGSRGRDSISSYPGSLD